jgi:hypothetical protein
MEAFLKAETDRYDRGNESICHALPEVSDELLRRA